MNLPLRSTEKDDPEFIVVVDRVIHGILTRAKPHDLYIIAVDNWFDHKWLRFSGIGVVPFEFPAFMNGEDALDEFWQEKLTLPPFSPKRVVCETYFRKNGAMYEQTEPPRLLHKRQRQHSEANLNRRIVDVSGSGCFVWYSSNTTSNTRASMMMYMVNRPHAETWFAAFKKRRYLETAPDKGNQSRLYAWFPIAKDLAASPISIA